MFNWFKNNCKCHDNVSEAKINYNEDTDANVWHAPVLNVGDFIEYAHKPTNKTYFLFVVELTPNLIRFGCADAELLYKINGKAKGYDLMNNFIESKNIKKLF